MTLHVPYSFVPGEKAKAQEVNANFLSLQNEVNQKIDTDFTNLSETGLENMVEQVKKNLGPGKKIGEIVYSTIPITDSAYHLLDGSLIRGSGIYSKFVEYIDNLYTRNPNANYFTDEITWQNSVTNHGVCGKFVYNSDANTVRLPKITGFIEGTIDDSELGNLIQAGLPQHTHSRGDMNITGVVTNIRSQNNGPHQYSGAFYDTGSRDERDQANGGNEPNEIGFDASRSWTGNTSAANYSTQLSETNTVQPQAIQVLVYICIATSTKTEIEVDIDEIATDLNGKADTDLTNTTNAGFIKMAKASMPSNTYTDLTIGASLSTYTAPADGWFYFSKMVAPSDSGTFIMLTNDTNGFNTCSYVPAGWIAGGVYLPVSKNDVVHIDWAGSVNNAILRFYYAVGSESEAN